MKRLLHPLVDVRGLLRLAVGVVGLAALLLIPSAARADSGSAKGRFWALLIGVEKYERVPQLRHTLNDVRQIARTLRERDGFKDECRLEMTEDSTDQQRQPRKATIEQEVPAWLKKPAPDDTVLVYFTGHGFRDAKGTMYLAPLDCDYHDLAKTGIPVKWLRSAIDACPAKSKLLVLDSCHAGSEKGEGDQQSVAGEDLSDSFKDAPGVITIASSSAREKSQIWEEKQQSLFSYWFNQALKGHSDKDGDGEVNIDELYEYVRKNVIRTTREVGFPLEQTPVRIIRSSTPDIPVVAKLTPLALRQVLNDMAEQLGNSIHAKRLTKVGVLEFTNDTKFGELLGADFGQLGHHCAVELEKNLANQAEGRFTVVDRRVLKKSLKELNFKVDDLGDTDTVKQLADKTDGMPVIALGTLRNRAGRIITLQCNLRRTDSDEIVGTAGGTAELSNDEWAMLGHSASLAKQDYRVEPSYSNVPVIPVSQQVFNRLEQKSTGPNPLQDPSTPYRLKFMFGGKERPLVFRGNDAYLPVRKGETFEIWVENRTEQVALMRLLIDGRNTLPEKENTKGMMTMVTGMPVSINLAKPWELDPKDTPADPRLKGVWAIRGFVSEIGTNGQVREFLVGDASEELGGRQKFGDDLGIITAAFYAPAGTSRGLQAYIVAGDTKPEEIPVSTSGHRPGNLLTVINVRYVSYEALQK
jgi:hypothetical protein